MAETRRRWKREARRATEPEIEFISAEARTSAFTRPVSDPVGDTVAEPGVPAATPRATADQYSAWATRLREKRVTAQQHIAFEGVTEDPADPALPNWSAENIFTTSQQQVDDEVLAYRDPVGVSAAYAILELEVGTDLDQVDAQYRKLAKRFHPDRFVGEAPQVQCAQADKFRAISVAREVIRQSYGLF